MITLTIATKGNANRVAEALAAVGYLVLFSIDHLNRVVLKIAKARRNRR